MPDGGFGWYSARGQGLEHRSVRLDPVLSGAKDTDPILRIHRAENAFETLLETAEDSVGRFLQAVDAILSLIPAPPSCGRIVAGRGFGEPFGMEVELNVMSPPPGVADLVLEGDRDGGIVAPQPEDLTHFHEKGDPGAEAFGGEHQFLGGTQNRFLPVDPFALGNRLPRLVVDREDEILPTVASHEPGMTAWESLTAEQGEMPGKDFLQRFGRVIASAGRPGGQEKASGRGQQPLDLQEERLGLSRRQIIDEIAGDHEVVTARREGHPGEPAGVSLEEGQGGVRNPRLGDRDLRKLDPRDAAGQADQVRREGAFPATEVECRFEPALGLFPLDLQHVAAIPLRGGFPDLPGILLAPVKPLEVPSYDHSTNPASTCISLRSERRRTSASLSEPWILLLQSARWSARTKK